jgi:two-component system, chemotaxis family, protein-glutamate methylesterase/glutaminase
MKKTRVVVAEDSATMRKYLVEVISAAEGFEVVGEAENGKQAIELCELLRPDVIAMDIVMPVMSGLAATEYIMAYCPTPTLIVSASVNRRETMRTYEALSAGAVDVLEKKLADEDQKEWEAKLISCLRVVSRVKVVTRGKPKRLPRTEKWPTQAVSLISKDAIGEREVRLLAVGASTGGPAAVAELLRALPKDFPIPLLVVIHISDVFAVSLVDWLNTISPIPVSFATDGARIPPTGEPCILFAPAGKHLAVQDSKIHLRNGPERNFCRPSVDVLFESVAEEFGLHAAFCLLTGMGRDGAAGLLAAKRSGAMTIAQDEASSVVFGMPGEAIKLGAADYVLPLSEIGPFVRELAN